MKWPLFSLFLSYFPHNSCIHSARLEIINTHAHTSFKTHIIADSLMIKCTSAFVCSCQHTFLQCVLVNCLTHTDTHGNVQHREITGKIKMRSSIYLYMLISFPSYLRLTKHNKMRLSAHNNK